MGQDHYLKEELFKRVRTQAGLLEFILSGPIDGVWFRDIEAPQNEWMSPGLWKTFGYDPSTKKHLASERQAIIDPLDLEATAETLRSHCADPAHPFDQVVRYRHKNESTVWVRCRGIAVRDAKGRAVRVLGAHTDITTLKNTETLLKLAIVDKGFVEEKFRTFVEGAPDAVVIVNQAGNLVLINTQTEKLFGYRRAELLGKPVEILVPERLRGAHAGLRKGYFASPVVRGQGEGLELTGRRQDGSEFPIDVSLSPLETADGVLVFGAIRDISKRKAAEQQCARLAAIVESTDDAILGLSLDNVITSWNQGAHRIFGYDAEEMVGRPLSGFIPKGAEIDEALVKEAVVRGEVKRFETVRTRKDGRNISISVTVSPIRDPSGRVVAISRLARDMTERNRDQDALEKSREATVAATHELEALKQRRVENALRESETRFQRLDESGIIGIIHTDVDGNILEANDAYLKMIGYTRADLLRGAIRWTELTPPEFRQRNDRAIDLLKASGVAPPWETESFRKDGSRVSILVGVATLEYPRCIAFVADLTQRKQAEVENSQLAAAAKNEQAARVRAESALQKTEEQFRQAQKMEAVGRLAGGIAHDFNNLLTVILSYSALILGDINADSAIRESVEEIRKAGKRAAELTRQLLMFSRQQVLEPAVLDLNDLLTGMAKMLHRLVGEDVELVSIAGTSLGHVRADPGSIEQLVMNLVVNARDAMPTGGKLTIETANVNLDDAYAEEHLGVRPGQYVVTSVSDTGTGIDKATQARIFEPFFTTKDKAKGTGLGLSTVFGIVQQSGGSIWVDSEPGKGATFKVYLPRVDDAVEVRHPALAPTMLRGAETILLVEDEEQVRAVTRGILKRQGYSVIEARNGTEALAACQQHSGGIDLLLTDVVMPLMSGPELARRLATARPAMKILCMSGYMDDAVLRHGALEAGIAFMQKPFTPDMLTAKIRDVLDARPSAEALERSQGCARLAMSLLSASRSSGEWCSTGLLATSKRALS
jgi:two-component system, cell cycle sensor histidine kinase and response regulator CckA